MSCASGLRTSSGIETLRSLQISRNLSTVSEAGELSVLTGSHDLPQPAAS